MESVEDLVIGKEAGMLLMVHKSLVDGFLYRGKPDLIPFQLLTVEDILQSFLLLLAVWARRLKFLWNSGCGAISKAMRAWLSPLAVNR